MRDATRADLARFSAPEAIEADLYPLSARGAPAQDVPGEDRSGPRVGGGPTASAEAAGAAQPCAGEEATAVTRTPKTRAFAFGWLAGRNIHVDNARCAPRS